MVQKCSPTVTTRKPKSQIRCILTLVILAGLNVCTVMAESAPLDVKANWHRFRGPGGGGVSVATDIPTHWNGQTGKGVLWKTSIPLSGRNSPIVWNGKVFCSGADKDTRQVYCFDATSGKSLWVGDVPTRPLGENGDLNVFEDTGLAACTMVTDGQRVYVIFATGDLAAFTLEGQRLWHTNLGAPDSSYGYASSLETYQNRVIVQYDQGSAKDGLSKLLAFDGGTGKLAWETTRPVSESWTSPIIVKVNDADQLITVADPWTMSHDPATGKELWRIKCGGSDLAPSAVYAGGWVYAVEPYSTLYAIRPNGSGDVTETHFAWRMEEGAPDICSPVSNGQWICLLDTMGEAAFFKTIDGSPLMKHEFDGEFMASPSFAGDKLYVLTVKGKMYVAEISHEAVTVIAENELGEEGCSASPAFVKGRIYIRSRGHLWAIGEQ